MLGSEKVLVGMVHLRALPGSPGYGGDMERVVERAVGDARALERGGADAALVENFGDAPYSIRVGPATVAAAAVVVSRVVEAVSIPVGVNLLRNDCPAAVAVAAASGASFIRCNAYSEVLVSDQGVLEPAAREVQEVRRMLGADVLVLADVMCKHATPLHRMTLEEAVRSAAVRGRADAVVITGRETGVPPGEGEVRRAAGAAGGVPVLVGSGVTPENAPSLLRWADGAIVGTYLKEGGSPGNPVDPARVAELSRVFRSGAGPGRIRPGMP